jgi:hypothetical protein
MTRPTIAQETQYGVVEHPLPNAERKVLTACYSKRVALVNRLCGEVATLASMK